MYTIKAKYDGLVPLMMDRFYNIADATTGASTKKGKKQGDAEIALKLHKSETGVFVPADNIRMMLIGNVHRRGAAKILGSDIEKGKGTKYQSMVEGCLWVVGPKDPARVYFDRNRLTYDDIDERSFINKTGGRGITKRPLILTPWSLQFQIQVTDDKLHESFVRELFDVAGLRCGLCAYGPTFGRCVISEWEVQGAE